jgi:hypothetical protein
VKDAFRFEALDRLEHRLSVGHVQLGEAHARLHRARQVLPLAAREVVKHQDLVPTRG